MTFALWPSRSSRPRAPPRRPPFLLRGPSRGSGVVPLRLQWQRFLVEHPLHGAHLGLSVEAGADYVGDLVEVERWVLGFEIHYESADVRRKPPSSGLLRREQPLDAIFFEALYPAPEGALGDAGLFGALGRTRTCGLLIRSLWRYISGGFQTRKFPCK